MYKVIINYNQLAKTEEYETKEEADVKAQEIMKEPNPEEVETWQGMGLEQPYEVLVVDVKKQYTKKVEYKTEEF